MFSSYWYRVKNLKPRLRSHARLHRHMYRGKRWYVLGDSSSGRHHRFNATAYSVIGLMDGQKTVQEIWDLANTSLGDKAPTQDEIIRLLGRLHAADVLTSDVEPDSLELFRRQQNKGKGWKQRLVNPFALRFPLLDPDRFLTKWKFMVSPLLSWTGLIIWLLIVGTGLLLAAMHWPELTANIADRVLAPKNLFLLWLVFPVVKLLHELAHAFVIRIWGGEVHEMGIMLLALTPIPYVEASASIAFPDKKRRMGVAAAGIAIELFIASLALFIWLNAESGLISAIAYNVMLICGVSTLLFNGNPLLRFDGYYILADAIEIPNLGQRSTKYLGYLLQRYLLGITDAGSPVTARGERFWFIGYGIAAFIYRIFVLTALILFVGSRFFFIGILLATWGVITQVVVPVVRNISRFINSPSGRKTKSRFLIITTGLVTVVLSFLLFVPAPLSTKAEGVIWLPKHSQIRAGTDCVVSHLLARNNSKVKKDAPLIQCEDPFLQSEVMVLEATLLELTARYNAEPLQSRMQRNILKEDISSAKDDLARARERKQKLTVYSPTDGQFILPNAQNLPGRFIKKGTLIGYVMSGSAPTARVVVSQSEISLVRKRTDSVEIRLAENFNTPLPATIDREIPAGSNRLPSPVLGTMGGGTIAVDPSDPDGLQTLKKIFQFEISLPSTFQDMGETLDRKNKGKKIRIGERVFARFDHGREPLVAQWYRELRQLFLKRFQI